MIETKVFELRDVATFIPIIASRMESRDSREAWLLRRGGYAPGSSLVLLSKVDGDRAYYDPYDWGGRTYPAAHQYIAENWDDLPSGALIDVRVILGETAEACATEEGL